MARARPKIKVLVPGGGTGNSRLLKAIAPYTQHLQITAVTSSWDNGGGSGVLLNENAVSMPTGDVGQCILSLSSLDDTEKNVYKHRDNSGQSLINLTLAAYEAEVGTFEGGVKAFGKRVGCRGNVFTVTRNRSRLRAQLHDGSWLECEHDIDTFKNDCDDPFRDVDLVAHDGKRLMSNKKVLSAAKHADIFVIPPGSFYTSILPNFLEPEFQKIVQASEAPIVAVANIANECHTRGWSAHRYADQISSAIGRQIDYLIANSGQPPGWLIEQYEAAGQDIVHVGERMSATKYEIVEKDLVTRQEIVIPETTGDVQRSVLRHPPHHLGATLLDIFADLGFNRQW